MQFKERKTRSDVGFDCYIGQRTSSNDRGRSGMLWSEDFFFWPGRSGVMW